MSININFLISINSNFMSSEIFRETIVNMISNIENMDATQQKVDSRCKTMCNSICDEMDRCFTFKL